MNQEMTQAGQVGSPAPRALVARWLDWIWAVLIVGGAAFAFHRYEAYMDGYEQAILAGSAASLIGLGWTWRPVQALAAASAALGLYSISLYRGELARADEVLLLKYLISSQSAILWMCGLFLLATVVYWIGLGARSMRLLGAGTWLTWSATALGFVGLFVRWYESYLVGPGIGHIPVSNLYEVFVLFALITALFHLYYQQRYAAPQLGAFVLLAVSGSVGFLLWYTFAREAHVIQPLVPALQSWWMKIHVPANFVGYGTFALAAMLGVAYLLAGRGVLADRLPALEVLDDVMYRAIAVGFAFFTVATILGALWAGEAWGTYRQWAPKQTWAAIVWLNYAAWLHMRMLKGMRGPVLAWWAIAGLLVTLFAFLGVNMFLSGLHSYGAL